MSVLPRVFVFVRVRVCVGMSVCVCLCVCFVSGGRIPVVVCFSSCCCAVLLKLCVRVRACVRACGDKPRHARVSWTWVSVVPGQGNEKGRPPSLRRGCPQVQIDQPESDSLLTAQTLEAIHDCLAAVETRVAELRGNVYTTIATAAAAPGAPPELDLGSGDVPADQAKFPLFGRLRIDTEVVLWCRRRRRASPASADRVADTVAERDMMNGYLRWWGWAGVGAPEGQTFYDARNALSAPICFMIL